MNAGKENCSNFIFSPICHILYCLCVLLFCPTCSLSWCEWRKKDIKNTSCQPDRLPHQKIYNFASSPLSPSDAQYSFPFLFKHKPFIITWHALVKEIIENICRKRKGSGTNHVNYYPTKERKHQRGIRRINSWILFLFSSFELYWHFIKTGLIIYSNNVTKIRMLSHSYTHTKRENRV